MSGKDVDVDIGRLAGRTAIVTGGSRGLGQAISWAVAEEQYDEIVDTNLKSLFFCCQEMGKRMIDRGGGNIINLGSIFSVVGKENFSVYSATKGGVLLLTKTLAIEWARHGINVNAIGPCATLTPMVAPLLEDPAFTE